MQPSLTLLTHRRIHLPVHLSYSSKELFPGKKGTHKTFSYQLADITTASSLLCLHGQQNTHAYTRNRGQGNTENIGNFWHFPCITCPLIHVHVHAFCALLSLMLKLEPSCSLLVHHHCHQCIPGPVSQRMLVHIL